MGETLLLIDGHSIAFRAFYGLPVENFATTGGQHTNAVHGFTSMLLTLLDNEQPTHLAVAFDVGRHTFRTDEYPDYKGTRAPTPPEFAGQIELICEVLDALNIRHFSRENYEADDIIATLSHSGAQAGLQVLIVSGDRDSFQLVNEQVTVLYPLRGVTELARLDPDGVEAKYLVSPERYPELAALVGETSDNLPGVPGVGPKTAAKWLQAYDGLDNLLARADEVKGKAGDALREHVADVRRNRQLNALVTDMDLDVTMDQLVRKSPNFDAVNQVFDVLEFRALRSRLPEANPAVTEVALQAVEVSGQVLAVGELQAWLAANAAGVVGLDVNGCWGGGTGDVHSVALATESGQACWFDIADLSPDDDAAFARWLADPKQPKIIHDLKGSLLAFWARGLNLNGIKTDTLLAAYLLNPDQRSYDFAALVVHYLKRKLVSDEADSGAQAAFDFGDDSGKSEAMSRARAVIDLAAVLEAELVARSQDGLLHDLELQVALTLARMERVGICMDTDVLDQLAGNFEQLATEAQLAALNILGHQVNLSSPKQLQAVLFDELGMPKTRRTQRGYTTDAEALEWLYEQTAHPFLAQLLQHRDSSKLRQSVEGLLKAVAADGRIHTTYLQTIAATGRLSSADPNLQNIPVRAEAGRRIRDAFVVGDGYETLLTADYSQIEMRIMAHLSKDDGLIAAFASGTDFHTVMASRVFGVAAEDVSGAQRARIKAINYGLAYGLSSYGLSQQLKVPRSEAKGLMEDYFSRFGHVRDYLQDVVATARQTGYTETILGRRRYLPDLNSTHRQRREMAERAALNAPIQGSAADIIKVAMLDVESTLLQSGMYSRMLLQVHDELIFEVAPGEAAALEELVRDKMGHAVELSVPLEVSIGIGRSWNEAAH